MRRFSFYYLIVKTQYKIVNLLFTKLTSLLFRKPLKDSKNIIIFRTGSIGDSICTFPAIDAIRQHYPNAKITLLTNSGSANYVSLGQLIYHELYDSLINYTTLSKFDVFKILRNNKYDLFIELTQAHATLYTCIRNAITVRMCGIPYAFGWQITVSHLFKKTQAKYHNFNSETSRFLNMLELNGIRIPEKISYPLNITETDQKLVSNMLNEKGIYGPSHKLVAIVLGSNRQANRWPIEYFVEIINYLQRKCFEILIIGGETDKKLLEGLSFYAKVYDFTGILTPLQSAALLEKCVYTISNDTGPMHLSYAVGTKVIALFSNRDYPNLWFPPKHISMVFRSSNIPCAICLKNICPKDNYCLRLIKPKMVIDYIESGKL